MQTRELFYPEIEVSIGQYKFAHGVSVEAHSDRDKPYDWTAIKFTKEFRQNITLSRQDLVKIRLGYNGVLEEVFSGLVTKAYNHAADENKIMVKDRMLLLEDVSVTNTFLDVTPQEMIEHGLREAGITDYHLSDMVFPVKKVVPIVQKNMVNVLKQINNLWGLDVRSYFIKGIFYWGSKPEQEETYQLEYGNNIISLTRRSGEWELVTVAMPFLQHSRLIKIMHPSIKGTFEITRMSFATNENGFIRTTLYFQG